MRHRASGSFTLVLPALDAISLFTPEGERDWVPGWDPIYPDGLASEDAGTVFVTESAGAQTIWAVIEIDRSAHHASYARITPSLHAGTVTVQLRPTGPQACEVSVSYDMTLLPGADAQAIEVYAASRFEAVIEEWQGAIDAWLGERA